jgi:hypothetical protein
MDPMNLFAALFWGSVGLGFTIYGRKRGRPVPLVGGIFLMAISYFTTPLSLTLIGVAVIAVIYFLGKRM